MKIFIGTSVFVSIRGELKCIKIFIFYAKIMLISFSMMTSSLSTAENNLFFSVAGRYESSSNALLSDNDEIELSGLLISPKIGMSIKRPDQVFNVDFSSDINRYNKDEFDSENYNFNGYFHRNRENLKSKISVLYRDEQIRDNTFDLDGNLQDPKDNRIVGVTTYELNYAMSEINSFNWQTSYQDVSYKTEKEINNYSDYQYGSTGLEWQHKITPLRYLTASIKTSQYKSSFEFEFALQPYINPLIGFYIPPPKPTEIAEVSTVASTTDVNVGFGIQMTEKVNWNLLIGSSEVKTTQEATIPFFNYLDLNREIIIYEESEYINKNKEKQFNANINVQENRYFYFIDASISNEDSSNGTIIKKSTVSVYGGFNLNVKNSINWRIIFQREKPIDEELVTVNQSLFRDYYRSRFSYDRKISKNFKATLEYSYYFLKNNDFDEKISSQILSLSLVYSPKPKRW